MVLLHLFKDLKILTVYSLYILECVMYVKNNQCYNNKGNEHVHHYFTRNKNNITLPNHNLQMYEKKTSYAGKRFFNHLPNSIKNVSNANKFRAQLKELLI